MVKQGTHLKPGELHRYWTAIEQGKAPQVPPGADDGLVERTMDIFVLAVEHLMFDSAYLEALRRCLRTGTNSDSLVETEDVPVGDNCPIIPRFLTPELRARWIEDITGLTNYAMEKGLGGSGEAHKPPSAPSSPPSKADTHRDANRQLYQVNKELASANATMEGKLDRIRGTLGSLTTKIADKTGENVVASDPVGRISATIRMLLLSQSEDHGENKENDSVEVTLLSNQLQKLNAANEELQNELVGLQYQLKEIRQQKKDRVKPEKNK